MTVKLTDTQLMMMSVATQRDDRCLKTPEKLKGAAAEKVGTRLLSLGFAREIKAKPGMPVWRRDERGQSTALKLTAAGLKAIAVEEEPGSAAGTPEAPTLATESSAAPTERSQHRSEAAPRDGSKLALVIGLLRQDDGATIGSLTQATGWLPHTARAAITGLRKGGYSVVRDRSEAGGSVYRISDTLAEGSVSNPDPTKAATASRRGSTASQAA
jgi:uncharacterized protein DUF3489